MSIGASIDSTWRRTSGSDAAAESECDVKHVNMCSSVPAITLMCSDSTWRRTSGSDAAAESENRVVCRKRCISNVCMSMLGHAVSSDSTWHCTSGSDAAVESKNVM